MLTPEELEKIPIPFEKLMSKLEYRIMQDIVERIKLTKEITSATDWQIYRLQQMGVSKKKIKEYIKEVLEITDKEIDEIYNNTVQEAYTRQKDIYQQVGKDFIEYNQNQELQQMINLVKEQTNDDFINITNSLGFVKNENGKTTFTRLTEYYQDILDNAMMDIVSGAFDYNSVIKNTVNEMTKSGLRTVEYASGHSTRVDVAVRRAVMTGLTQVTNKINEDNAKQLDTNYFEISWHSTARPSHQVWQGRVYNKDELVSVCGLGTPGGLNGVNCRHSYYPFIPGVSKRTYTDEQLDEMNAEENKKVKYGNKEYTKYEAAQEQRRFERLMRKQRQDIKLLKEGQATKEDIITAQARYRITSDEYVNFSKSMGLPQQRERIYQDGLKGKYGSAKSYKAIESRANLYYNTGSADGNIQAYLKDETIRKNIRDNTNKTINLDKQNRHQLGTKEYKENRSYLTISNEEIQELVNKYSGTGYIERDRNGRFANKELIIADKNIGVNINLDTLEKTSTNRFYIHYSKTGTHIVPTNKGVGKNEIN